MWSKLNIWRTKAFRLHYLLNNVCITTLFGARQIVIFNEHFICSLKLYNSHFNLWLHSVLLSLLYLHKRRFTVLSVIELTMFGASTAYRIALRIFSLIQCQFHYGNAVADPEGDPRVPWILPFRLNLACKTELKATYQRSDSLSQLALSACLYNLATNNH